MMRFTVILLCVLMNCALSSGKAEENAPVTITVGLLDSFNPEEERDLILPTIEYLKDKFPQRRWELIRLNSVKPVASVRRAQPDFVISSSGTFQELHQALGYNHVVTAKSIFSDNPSESVASVFVALKSRDDLKDLRSLNPSLGEFKR